MSTERARIIVTGGAGNIGSHLVDVLVERGDRVVVVDDFSVGSRSKIAHHGPAIEIIEADIRDRALMQRVVADADLVIHLAVQCLRASIKDPFLVQEVNVAGTLNLLQACLENRVPRFVYVSSSESYGSAVSLPMSEDHPLLPTTPYGASKAAGEHFTNAYRLTYGLDTRIVRPFNAYGPRFDVAGIYGTVIPRFLIRVLNDQPPVIYGDGEQTRDYTFVRDSAEGIVAAALSEDLDGSPVNIARGEPITVNAIAEHVLQIAGRTRLQPEIYKPRPGDVRRHWGDGRKAREVLGFEAPTDVATGIGRYMEWLLAEERSHPGQLAALLATIPTEAW